MILLNRTKDRIELHQSALQRGFTSGSSTINASLITSEAQNEAKENSTPLKLVTLDACKAFDVVWQDSLLRKIFNIGIGGSLWTCIKNLYEGAQARVKWSGHVYAAKSQDCAIPDTSMKLSRLFKVGELMIFRYRTTSTNFLCACARQNSLPL